jgi:hypothetical protein
LPLSLLVLGLSPLRNLARQLAAGGCIQAGQAPSQLGLRAEDIKIAAQGQRLGAAQGPTGANLHDRVRGAERRAGSATQDHDADQCSHPRQRQVPARTG